MMISNVSEIPVIEFKNVSFHYANNPVLQNVSFVIHPQDRVCIVGPNGGGKTTLLKIILGFLKPSTGTVLVFGKPPGEAVSRIGYMPQYIHYDPMFPITCLDVVLMARLKPKYNRYSSADRTIALQALEEVGMAKLQNELFGQLSGGQRQRVLIARALALEPDLLLLDEPTSNIDLEGEIRLHEILERIQKNKTVILVTHDLSFVTGLTTTILCVNRRVVTHAPGMLSEDVLKEMYGTDIRLVRHNHIM